VSPFDLYGPEFLAFYLLLGVCVLFALARLRHAGESADPPAFDLSDPYLIAYLRGGKNEVLRIATVSLIDRGFLTVQKSRLAAAPDRRSNSLRLPIEQKLITHFTKEDEAASVFKSRAFDREMAAYEDRLILVNLLPDAAAKGVQNTRAAIGILVLWGVATIKIVVALSRGRSNVQFLIMLAVLLAIPVVLVTRTRHTRRGDAMLDSLRTLFGSLKDRSSAWLPGANPSELVLLAAVFGVAAIPATVFPYTKSLYPQASSSGGSSCGSSCGSGCGGGGCGGGCGGCGS
jgi:uncharacterized protein (TIGR04222 family)